MDCQLLFSSSIRSSQSNNLKIKIKKLKSHRLPTYCHLFSYIKREMRDREKERKKRDKRNKKKSNNFNFKQS
jgi:hypothetical protein